VPAGVDIEVVAQPHEWGQLQDDSDEEDNNGVQDRIERHASESHLARERRLTAGAEALRLLSEQENEPVGQRDSVIVVTQDKEWGEEIGEDSSEEADADDNGGQQCLSRCATDSFLAREKRLSAGAQALAFASLQPTASEVTADEDVRVMPQDVAVVTERKEWNDLEEDSDDGDDGERILMRHASNLHLSRERRLTAGAESLTLVPKQAQPAQTDVEVVAQSKEWCELEEDSDDEAAGQSRLTRHASDLHLARERRLTAGAEVLTLAPHQVSIIAGEHTVEVVALGKEWSELEEDSDPDEADDVAVEKLTQHAAYVHSAREKRLTAGAEALQLALTAVAGN